MQQSKFLPFLFLLFLFFFSSTSFAQNRFRAGVVAGGNASQIRGDDTAGYNKIGVVGGLRVDTRLKKNMGLTLEIVYSQRGSRNSRNEIFDVEIDLQYIEVPVLFQLKDWYQEDKDYYRVAATAGFAYSRLFGVEQGGVSNCHLEESDNFIEDDYGLVLGAEVFFTKRFSLSARWYTSLNLLYDRDQHEPSPNSPCIDLVPLNSLRPHFLSFRLNYFL